MLRFLYNLFFPTKPNQMNDKQEFTQDTKESLFEEDEQELMSCREKIITPHEYPKLTFQEESEILDLIKRFENKTLPLHEWTHTSHLIVAAYYLKSYTSEEAQVRLRSSIKSYNEAVGIINSPTSGYHETITIFWLHFVRYILGRSSFDLLSFSKLFQLVNKNMLLEFYSNELIQSTEARQHWVEPDKKALNFSHND